MTGPSINTGVGVTLVDIMLAVAAREARRAQAGEGVDAIHAGTTIETGASDKKKNGGRGLKNTPNILTSLQHSFSFYSFIIEPRNSVSALPLSAVGGVVLAVDAAEARGAAAGVAVHEVCAVGPVFAGVAVALVDVLLTYRPTEPWQAGAHKAADAIGAGSVITAGVWVEKQQIILKLKTFGFYLPLYDSGAQVRKPWSHLLGWQSSISVSQLRPE